MTWELKKVVGVGLFVGLLLNLTGWLANNLVLGEMWRSLVVADAYLAWRDSPWSDVLSLVPDFVYGLSIAWMFVATRGHFSGWVSCGLAAGLFVAVVGGLTTYLAVANSGFIPWPLAWASFVLVLATKLPLAVLGGRMLERSLANA